MFLPKALTAAANGAVIYPVTNDGRDLNPRFRKPAKALPSVTTNAVLRLSSTGKAEAFTNPLGTGRVGNVGLAMIDAEKRRAVRNADRIKRIARARA